MLYIMLDWFWRTLGYELEKDVIKAWALNKMKEEKIEEQLRLERLKSFRVAPALPSRKSNRIKEKSQKQKHQQKSYTETQKALNDEIELQVKHEKSAIRIKNKKK